MALRLEGLRMRVLTGDALTLSLRVNKLNEQFEADRAQVDSLTKAGGDIDIAQQNLDADMLEDAQEELSRQTGDKRSQIQVELARREGKLKDKESNPKPPIAVKVVQREWTLWGRVSRWLDQRYRAGLVAEALNQSIESRNYLLVQHDELAKKLERSYGSRDKSPNGPTQLKLLHEQDAEHQVLALLEDRIGTNKQLGAVYTDWERQLLDQNRFVSKQTGVFPGVSA